MASFKEKGSSMATRPSEIFLNEIVTHGKPALKYALERKYDEIGMRSVFDAFTQHIIGSEHRLYSGESSHTKPALHPVELDRLRRRALQAIREELNSLYEKKGRAMGQNLAKIISIHDRDSSEEIEDATLRANLNRLNILYMNWAKFLDSMKENLKSVKEEFEPQRRQLKLPQNLLEHIMRRQTEGQ